MSNLDSLQGLQALLEAREARLLAELSKVMSGAKGGDEVFDMWMKRNSDLVQGAALAYAEREVMDCSVAAVNQEVPTTGACVRVSASIAWILCGLPWMKSCSLQHAAFVMLYLQYWLLIASALAIDPYHSKLCILV